MTDRKRWPALETSALDLLVLADLGLALEHGTHRLPSRERCRWLRSVQPMPLLYLLPTALRDGIETIHPSDIPVLAKAWAEGEEAANRGLTAEIAKLC